MSGLIAYLGLALLPFSLCLPLNPVEFWWGYNHGAAPMPLETAGKADRIAPLVGLASEASLVLLVSILMWGQAVGIAAVGLRGEHWRAGLLIGCAAGLLWAGPQGVLLRTFPEARRRLTTRFQKGSALSWVLVVSFGAFAEELWRAFCLVTLQRAGYSLATSVILTAAVFGLSHSPWRVNLLPKVIFGGVAALLFLWLRSLLPTYLFHLISNLGSLYWIRHARVARE